MSKTWCRSLQQPSKRIRSLQALSVGPYYIGAVILKTLCMVRLSKGSNKPSHYLKTLSGIPSHQSLSQKMSSPINPAHYTSGDIECIDAIKAQMTQDEFLGYLRGNNIKYLWRYRQKGGAEDLRKAEWYLRRLISEFELDPFNDPLA